MLNWNDIITWQILSVINGIVVVILTFLLFIITRKKKELRYYLLGVRQLISNKYSIKEKIDVISGKKKVNYATVVGLKIINTGNVPILKNDFVKPIIINFGNDAKISDIIIEKLEPPNIEIKLSGKDNYIELLPVLLNRGDNILFKVFLSQYQYRYDKLTVTARIVGIKEIKDITFSKTLMGKVPY